MFFPPAILIPIHTLVQLGVGASRVFLMWPYILRDTVLPFAIGAALGAAAGAQIFVTLPAALLYGFLCRDEEDFSDESKSDAVSKEGGK